MARTKNNGRQTTTDITKSNSFALFGDGITVSNNSNNVDLFSKAVKKNKETDSIKQIGSQHTDEKSESPELSNKEIRHQAKRGFRSLKINQDNISSESDSTDVKGQNDSKTDGGSKPSGSKSGKVKANDSGSVIKTRRNKRKVQKDEGGTGVHENDNSNSKVVDYNKYPVCEFEITDRIQNYSIQAKPRVINDFLVEVIINGYRYKVSPWSIKDGQYVQGLDSNFLVSKYKVGRNKKNDGN